MNENNRSLAYADLEIRILTRQEEGYPVELTVNSEQEFSRGYLDPNFLPWVPTAWPTADGERLFEWLMADDPLKLAWAELRGQQPLRRIRLRIDDAAPELHPLPWELLRDPGLGGDSPAQDLAATVTTPFSRYLAGKWQPGSPILKRPIKILVAMANPQDLVEAYDLAAIEEDEEWALLEEATVGLEVELTRLPSPCILSALEAELKKGYHILHIIGHGRYSEADGQTESVLFMADTQNQTQLVSQTEFAAMLARQLTDIDTSQHNKLRLVFLASCQTATRSSADAFRGFAPALVAAGLPAVLAMQEPVAVETARSFAQTFYRQLLQHGQVDLACNEARSALLTGDFLGASIPVLFMRLRSGLLFTQPGQILAEQADTFWDTLLRNIADGECTPFMGPGVTAGLLPSPQELAQSLAARRNYPFPERDNLPRVAQFIGTFDNRRLRKEVIQTLTNGFRKRLDLKADAKGNPRELSETIQEVWSDLGQPSLANEIHHQLAALNLPVYLTTNFDNCMALALSQVRQGEPRREIVRWRELLKKDASRPHYDLDPPPAADEPVVVHLFGTDDDLLSMVLTEDDYLDYLATISRNHEYLLPTSVHEALASTTLLFLGYQLEDLELKVIMRGLLTNLDLERWGMLHVAVQIDIPSMDEVKNQEVIQFFQKYFSRLKIDVYWGSTRQFVADLYARWQEGHDHD